MKDMNAAGKSEEPVCLLWKHSIATYQCIIHGPQSVFSAAGVAYTKQS